MPTVELIYDGDCPNVSETRVELLRALTKLGLPAGWREWERGKPDSPDYVRRFGSPTVLVDGREVSGAAPSDTASCCRLYADGAGKFRGSPSAELIASALSEHISESGLDSGGAARSWQSLVAVVPGVALSLLPNVTCPACWPVYAGLASSLGLPFVLNAAYLLPLTVLALIVAVGALGFRASRRRGYGPFVVGVVAASAVLIGKFVFDLDVAIYGGITLLVAASIWNTWPQTAAERVPCPKCAPAGSLYEVGSTEQQEK